MKHNVYRRSNSFFINIFMREVFNFNCVSNTIHRQPGDGQRNFYNRIPFLPFPYGPLKQTCKLLIQKYPQVLRSEMCGTWSWTRRKSPKTLKLSHTSIAEICSRQELFTRSEVKRFKRTFHWLMTDVFLNHGDAKKKFYLHISNFKW